MQIISSPRRAGKTASAQLRPMPNFDTCTADELREFLAFAPNALRALLSGADPAELKENTRRQLGLAMGAPAMYSGYTPKARCTGLLWAVTFSMDGDKVLMQWTELRAPKAVELDLWALRTACARCLVQP